MSDYDLWNLKEKKEESGPGAGQQGETELVANEDNKDKTEADDKEKQEDKQQEDNNEINKQQIMDQVSRFCGLITFL